MPYRQARQIEDVNLMPRGPKGERRPADVIGNAVHVMKVATGEIEEEARQDDPVG
jgi:hypothetical protein